MASIVRPLSFLIPSPLRPFNFRSPSFIASGSPHRATPSPSPFQTRPSTLMRYAITSLLVLSLILSVAPDSVRALLPLIRKSTSTPLNTELVTALSTVPSDSVAQTISHALVSSNLVACVNTIPGIKSTYWWQGGVQHDTELLLIMKTTKSLVPQVIEQITKLHPYDVPEVIVQPIVAGHLPYLNWISESTRKQPPS